jgi:hypothetical protein
MRNTARTPLQTTSASSSSPRLPSSPCPVLRSPRRWSRSRPRRRHRRRRAPPLRPPRTRPTTVTHAHHTEHIHTRRAHHRVRHILSLHMYAHHHHRARTPRVWCGRAMGARFKSLSVGAPSSRFEPIDAKHHTNTRHINIKLTTCTLRCVLVHVH